MATGLENLKIYQMSKRLELWIHELIKGFPREEKYRSSDQLKRSSSSVTNNIAESYWKRSVKDKSRVLRDLALAEAEETRSNILRCAEKGYLDSDIVNSVSEGYIELRKAT
ncbi:MAG: four helix bundle protein [Candidatus Sungbacteria bacterium]|nr:four helix bundle protein [Candidatus Sungbacteria bacterium]